MSQMANILETEAVRAPQDPQTRLWVDGVSRDPPPPSETPFHPSSPQGPWSPHHTLPTSTSLSLAELARCLLGWGGGHRVAPPPTRALCTPHQRRGGSPGSPGPVTPVSVPSRLEGKRKSGHEKEVPGKDTLPPPVPPQSPTTPTIPRERPVSYSLTTPPPIPRPGNLLFPPAGWSWGGKGPLTSDRGLAGGGGGDPKWVNPAERREGSGLGFAAESGRRCQRDCVTEACLQGLLVYF